MAGGDGRPAHAPHRVRQRRHPHVRAMDQPRTGDRDPGIARRRPLAHLRASADRVGGACHCRRDTRRLGDAGDAGALPAECSWSAGLRPVDRSWPSCCSPPSSPSLPGSCPGSCRRCTDAATPDQPAPTAAPVRSGPAAVAARARRHGNLRHGRADGRGGGTGRRLAPDVGRRHRLSDRAASDRSGRESGRRRDFHRARSRQACARRGQRRRIDRRSHGDGWLFRARGRERRPRESGRCAARAHHERVLCHARCADAGRADVRAGGPESVVACRDRQRAARAPVMARWERCWRPHLGAGHTVRGRGSRRRVLVRSAAATGAPVLFALLDATTGPDAGAARRTRRSRSDPARRRRPRGAPAARPRLRCSIRLMRSIR